MIITPMGKIKILQETEKGEIAEHILVNRTMDLPTLPIVICYGGTADFLAMYVWASVQARPKELEVLAEKLSYEVIVDDTVLMNGDFKSFNRGFPTLPSDFNVINRYPEARREIKGDVRFKLIAESSFSLIRGALIYVLAEIGISEEVKMYAIGYGDPDDGDETMYLAPLLEEE